MKYLLSIAGLYLQVESPFEIEITEETIPFLYDGDKKADCVIKYSTSQEKEFVPDHSEYSDANHIYCGSDVYFTVSSGSKPYAKMYIESENPLTLVCEYAAGKESYINFAKNVYSGFQLERILLYFDTMIMHASFVGTKQYGILFSASSGVGKSTQASLWETYEDAEVINGDRTGIRKIDGEWHAFGLPIAGTSGIFKNQNRKIKCIVLLEQAKENEIEKVSVSEAYRFLYPELMIHRWDPDFEQKASELMLELIREIPVYRLRCLPDRGAVIKLKERIEEGE